MTISLAAAHEQPQLAQNVSDYTPIRLDRVRGPRYRVYRFGNLYLGQRFTARNDCRLRRPRFCVRHHQVYPFVRHYQPSTTSTNGRDDYPARSRRDVYTRFISPSVRPSPTVRRRVNRLTPILQSRHYLFYNLVTRVGNEI